LVILLSESDLCPLITSTPEPLIHPVILSVVVTVAVTVTVTLFEGFIPTVVGLPDPASVVCPTPPAIGVVWDAAAGCELSGVI
jgi:hypothetical protein